MFSQSAEHYEIRSCPLEVLWSEHCDLASIALPPWLTFNPNTKILAFLGVDKAGNVVRWFRAPIVGAEVRLYQAVRNTFGESEWVYRGIVRFPVKPQVPLDRYRVNDESIVVCSGEWAYECRRSRGAQ